MGTQVQSQRTVSVTIFDYFRRETSFRAGELRASPPYDQTVHISKEGEIGMQQRLLYATSRDAGTYPRIGASQRSQSERLIPLRVA